MPPCRARPATTAADGTPVCGIFAMFLNRPLTEADVALGRAGTAALAHRGPDGQGEWTDRAAGVFLGHRRLAIIDPTPDSKQPFALEHAAMTYNGELYNYRALRDELAALGVRCQTRGDVEVLLRAWRRWGDGALDKFDGMFAAAIWDGQRAHLMVDPFGEKPLLWAETPAGVYVSSEIAPLVALLGMQPDLDPSAWAAYLGLGYFPAPATAYKGICRLPAGSVLAVEKGKATAPKRYWTPPVPRPGRGPVQPLGERDIDRLASTLARSLEGRLESDVPLALFLSAGTDSALVAAIAARELGVRLKSLTVAVRNGSGPDESADAARIAAHLGFEHEILPCDEDAGRYGIEALLHLFAQPSDGTGIFPFLQLSEAVSSRFKVALTGMGGDEVTWGYGKNLYFYARRHWFQIPEPLRRAGGKIARTLGGASAKVRRHADTIGVRDCELYLAQKNAPALAWLRRAHGWPAWAKRAMEPGSAPIEYWVPTFEMREVMPNVQLLGNDLGSMRYGLEVRTPFLSRAVVAEVAGFDARALLAFGQKSVLRRLLGRYLPADLVDRPKSGLTFPVQRLLGGAPPAPLPGLTIAMAEEAWRRRFESGGWERIALRLAVADRFLNDARSHKAVTPVPLRATA